jgi:hypothetical protein
MLVDGVAEAEVLAHGAAEVAVATLVAVVDNTSTLPLNVVAVAVALTILEQIK